MKNITSRLKRINGQISGVIKMIDEKKDCEQVIMQFQAAKAALDSAYSEVLKKNLEECLQKKDTKSANNIVRLIAKS